MIKKFKFFFVLLFSVIISCLLYKFISILLGKKSDGVPKGYHISYFNDFKFKTESILFYNVNSDSILYEKNANQRRSPASITKIMTYIIVFENVKDKNERVKVKKEVLNSISGTQSSLAGLKTDEDYSVSELLVGMMVPSGNDAALVLADYTFGGNIGLFVDKMNQKASELGCENTHFSNPHGLYDENHYTTCYDLLKIINYALKIRDFRNIIKICETEIKDKKIKNSNLLLEKTSDYYCKYVKGIKTGYHSQAGCCLSSLAELNGIEYIGIFLGAPAKDENGKKLEVNYAFEETKNLCNYTFENLKVKRIPILENPKIRSTRMGIDVPYSSFSSIDVVVPRDFEDDKFKVKFELKKISEDDFPIHKGEKLGEVQILYENVIIRKKDIVCSKDTKLSFTNNYIQLLKKVFSN